MKNVKCTLSRDVNDCPYYEKDKMLCNNSDPSCGFQIEEHIGSKEDIEYNRAGYKRGERWYEKYYRKRYKKR